MGNFSSDLSFFIGIISFLVAIIFFLFTFIARPLNKLQEKISRLEKGSGGKLESPALLSSNFFLTALEKERKFWSKITEERDNKTLIALTIANKYIERNDTILMDSGTTVDQIPLFPVEKGYNSTIYTNNLLAAILVIPYGEEIDCPYCDVYALYQYIEELEKEIEHLKKFKEDVINACDNNFKDESGYIIEKIINEYFNGKKISTKGEDTDGE